jgi:hypothetical protein
MLTLAVEILGAGVVVGMTLAVIALMAPAKPPARILASLHGLLVTAGYAILIDALMTEPARGTMTGTQSFGLVAAVLLGIAIALGIASLVLHMRQRRMPGVMIGVHASVAIAGYVMLFVYWRAG